MNLFGKKKQKPAPKLGDAMQKLRGASDNLEKRQQHLEKKVQACMKEARKKSKAKDKRGAMHQLKKKKMYEKQIDQLYAKQENIDMQLMALENAASNKDTLEAMKHGAQALKAQVKESDIDKVEDQMEDINESMALANELGEAMAQPIGDPIDEDDLEEDFKALEDAMAEEDIQSLGLDDLESAPTNKLISEEKEAPEQEEEDEEDELRRLELEMGM